MEISIGSRFKRAWNAFTGNRDPTTYHYPGASYSYRPDRPRFSRGNEKSIITAVYNRMAVDAATVDIKHVQLDDNERYQTTLKTGLNECLTLSANLDQTGRAFRQDMFMTMLDKGCCAIVATDTTEDPCITDDYDVESFRVGEVVEWYPKDVKVRLYNESTGKREDIILPKRVVAIPENPFYAVCNEPSSTVKRLVRKLVLLDAVDEISGSGKLDLIIQLPYVIKTDARRKQADERRADIARQLKESQLGIAYTDGTERITQLNRPVENNLLKQIEYLTNLMYSQLGIHQGIMDGTASVDTKVSYDNRTIEPMVAAAVDAIKRTFLSKDARDKGESIMSFRDPFRLVPVEKLAEISDKLTRNRILTSNEFRQTLGYKPSDDPEADKLVNSNIRQPNEQPAPVKQEHPNSEEGGK